MVGRCSTRRCNDRVGRIMSISDSVLVVLGLIILALYIGLALVNMNKLDDDE